MQLGAEYHPIQQAQLALLFFAATFVLACLVGWIRTRR